MKNLFILLSVFWSLSAIGASEQKGYFGVFSGMGISLDKEGQGISLVQEGESQKLFSPKRRDILYKFGLEYGTQLMSQNSYVGLFGAGGSIYTSGILLFHLKYGYELMRKNQVSLGLDASALFGSKGIVIDDLLIGGALGVSGKVSISQSVAIVIRVTGELLRTFTGSVSREYPTVEGSFRWYLK